MSTDKQMTLQISARQIDQFCAELCRGSSNTSRKHSALIALEGFVIRHTSTDKYTDVFTRIIGIIQQYAEQTRTELLNEYADRLEPALINRNRTELARTHQSVSRNGFDRLLGQVLVKLTPDQQSALKLWVESWILDAESKARQASGFPDAFNFKGAQIPLDEYRAMTELQRKLTLL